MAKLEWLKNQFVDGYDSGDVLAEVPSARRLREEGLSGGSYAEVFKRAILPFLRPDSTVLELGPGKGSWTRPLLRHLPAGHLHAVDFVQTQAWFEDVPQRDRLHLHRAEDFSFSMIEQGSIDFFWSFGVLCHHSIEQITSLFTHARPKMKPGGVAVHHYGHWEKLYQTGRIQNFQGLAYQPLEESPWPPNLPYAMAAAAEAAGWLCIEDDMDLLSRDGLILLKAW